MNTKVYEIITERILDALKTGVAPWHKPWRQTCYNGKCGSFWNLKAKRPYRGLNVFILASTPFASPWWVTFKQAKELGGQVRKGERGTQVIFWKILEVVESRDGDIRVKKIPMLRYYTVFNVEQCDGLEGKIPQTDKTESPAEFSPIEAAESIVEGMPQRPDIQHGGDRASYSPSFDIVRMPQREAFDTNEHYYSTLFHELGHSTGHSSRLARKGVDGEEGNWSPFGSPGYAKEELVAEMTAAFLCGTSGIEGTFNSSASYLEHWRKHISDDPTLVVHAASAAQKAADFVLGKSKTADENESKTNEETVAA